MAPPMPCAPYPGEYPNRVCLAARRSYGLDLDNVDELVTLKPEGGTRAVAEPYSKAPMSGARPLYASATPCPFVHVAVALMVSVRDE